MSKYQIAALDHCREPLHRDLPFEAACEYFRKVGLLEKEEYVSIVKLPEQSSQRSALIGHVKRRGIVAYEFLLDFLGKECPPLERKLLDAEYLMKNKQNVTMDEKHKKVLTRGLHNFINNLDLNDFIPYLMTKAVMSSDDYRKIHSFKTTPEKVMNFILSLQTKGPEAFEYFKEALNEHSRYAYLRYKVDCYLKEYEDTERGATDVWQWTPMRNYQDAAINHCSELIQRELPFQAACEYFLNIGLLEKEDVASMETLPEESSQRSAFISYVQGRGMVAYQVLLDFLCKKSPLLAIELLAAEELMEKELEHLDRQVTFSFKYKEVEQYLDVPRNLNIIVLGKTGNGKSAIGNLILGKKNEFLEGLSMDATTKTFQKETTDIYGFKIDVLDTPGLFDTRHTVGSSREDILLGIKETSPEFLHDVHLFLFVCRSDIRFSYEEMKALEVLQEICGDDLLNYCLLVVTFAHPTFEEVSCQEYLQQNTGLHTLFTKTFERAIFVDRAAILPLTRELKRDQLIHAVVDIVSRNRGQAYEIPLSEATRVELELEYNRSKLSKMLQIPQKSTRTSFKTQKPQPLLQQPLEETESIITKSGGTLKIPGTSVSLSIPQGALPEEMDECLIKMRILPRGVFQDPLITFCSYSSVVVEILPNNLLLQCPARLHIPHSLVLKTTQKTETQTTKIFLSHHEQGSSPCWVEHSNIDYCVEETYCAVWLNQFCWVTVKLDDREVLAKKLVLYSCGKEILPTDKFVTVIVGYYPDLDGEGKFLSFNTSLIVSEKCPFTFMKEGSHPLRLMLEKFSPSEWSLWFPEGGETSQEIPFNNISACDENHRKFVLKRTADNALRSVTVLMFKASQEQGQETPLEFKMCTSSPHEFHSAPQLRPQEDAMNATFRYLSKNLGQEWKSVGRELGLEDGELHRIENDHKETLEAIYQMLVHWKQKEGHKATHARLINSLVAAERTDLAEKVQERGER